MTANPVLELGQSPGEPPRSHSISRFMDLSPAPLQIGVIVIPLTAIGLLVWNHYEPGRAGPMPWLALVLGTSVLTI